MSRKKSKKPSVRKGKIGEPLKHNHKKLDNSISKHQVKIQKSKKPRHTTPFKHRLSAHKLAKAYFLMSDEQKKRITTDLSVINVAASNAYVALFAKMTAVKGKGKSAREKLKELDNEIKELVKRNGGKEVN